MSGAQPVCNCQCEEKSSPFSRARARQCGVRQREQSPPSMHVSWSTRLGVTANISCVLGSRPTSSTNCMSTSPCYPLSKPRFLALSPKQYECFLSIRGHVCSMFIIVHTANTNISRIFSLGMRQHAQILKRSPACNIVRHLRIVRDICTNIYYYLMFGYLIFKEVLP